MALEAWSSAEPYERYMGRWSRLLASAAVAWLDPPSGLRWLDVGCGTGALSAAVLGATDPQSLVGLDPSPAYVRMARERQPDQRATFEVGDATALEVPDASVDRVVCGLVLNFVPDPTAAVAEMRRVLVPGGRLAVYVWDYGDGMQMLSRFWAAVIAEDPAATGLDEHVRFPLCREGALERFVGMSGWTDVIADSLVVPTVFRDFDDYWTPFLGEQGSAPGYVATLPEEARNRLRDRLRASLPTEPDGSIRLTARAYVVQATR